MVRIVHILAEAPGIIDQEKLAPIKQEAENHNQPYRNGRTSSHRLGAILRDSFRGRVRVHFDGGGLAAAGAAFAGMALVAMALVLSEGGGGASKRYPS